MHSTTLQDIRNARRATSLRLNLDEQTARNQDLAVVLAACTRLSSIELPLQRFFVTEPRWNASDHLFVAMGKLEHLLSITIKGRTLAGNPFPIRLLEHVLYPGRNRLRHLHVDMQRMLCPPRHVRTVASLLQQQTCLEWIKLKYSKPLTSNTASESLDFQAMDPVFCSLRKIQTLRHVQIVGASEGEDDEFAFEVEEEDFPTLSPSCVAEMLANPSLTELRLEWLDLSAATIATLSNSLTFNTSLKRLVLGLFPENESAYQAFGQMLQTNHTLEVIHVHTSWRTPSDWTPLVAPAKETTRSLDKLLLYIAKALPDNQRLKEFHLCGPTIQEIPLKAEKVLVKALQCNLSLTSLQIGSKNSEEGDLCGALDYYLKLNQLNRKHYVQNYEQVATSEWIQLLATASRDLNAIFYFLRLNPFLCHTDGSFDQAQAIERTKSRRKKRATEPSWPALKQNRSTHDRSLSVPRSDQAASALSQAVATVIENVADTMEAELRFRDEKEERMQKEIECLRREIELLKRSKRSVIAE